MLAPAIVTLSIAVGVAACKRPASSAEAGGSQNTAADSAISTTESTARPMATTQEGGVVGTNERGTFVFRGVPYAAPPVGRLRWRAPEPPAMRASALDAEYFGRACIQPPGLSAANGGEPGATSEDCLTLNIWSSSLGASAKLPVFVWIHGGAFIFGAGNLDVYNGASLASRGAVVVTLNYRLGQLGFFAHPALERESPRGPVNFGLLDQIQALTWIQQNIAAFGGDPGNVTIGGQSAGARSVLSLFTSPLARGLFHKGIAQSSYAIPDVTRLHAITLGIAAARASGLNGAAATTAELRAIPATGFETMVGRTVSMMPALISGDDVLPRSAQEVFAARQEAPLPLMLGSTSDDGSVVQGFGFNFAELVKGLGAAKLPLRVLYPGVRDDGELGRQAIRDVVFTMNARWAGDRHAEVAPTWRYYFDYSAIGLRLPDFKGVVHGGDVLFTMDSHAALGSPSRFTDADRAFSKRVGDYWFAFIKNGAPAVPGAPEWPAHTRSQDTTMIFTDPPVAERDFSRARLNVYIASLSVLDRLLKR